MLAKMLGGCGRTVLGLIECVTRTRLEMIGTSNERVAYRYHCRDGM